MIKSFGHKGLQAFFERHTKAGIRPDHAPKLTRLLARLDVAASAPDMNVPGWRLHPLSDDLKGALGRIGQWQLANDFYL